MTVTRDREWIDLALSYYGGLRSTRCVPPQINPLISPHLGKQLEEQDTVEGTRFQTKDTQRNRWRTNYQIR
jgi:hypothetical protein